MVYSGDTGPTDALVTLADGADLLLCEASFVEGDDNDADLHLTGREAGDHAQRAGAGRVDFGAPHGLTDAEGVALLGTAVLPQLR